MRFMSWLARRVSRHGQRGGNRSRDHSAREALSAQAAGARRSGHRGVDPDRSAGGAEHAPGSVPGAPPDAAAESGREVRAGETRVLEVLRGWLDEPTARAAARSWRDSFSGLPGQGVIAFVASLEAGDVVPAARAPRLRMALFEGLYTDGADRARRQLRPGAVPGAYGSSSARAARSGGRFAGRGDAQPGPPPTPSMWVGSALIRAIHDLVAPESRPPLRERWLSHLAGAALVSAEERAAIAGWDGVGDLPVPDSEAALRAIVHALYLALCDVLGPAVADRCMEMALDRVESLGASRECSPRRLM